MAGIVTGPGKHPEHHSLKEVVNGENVRHLVAIALALVLVCMVVGALLLSANEGAASLN
ncbi:MAG: hypothetical protein ABWZ40_07985 [Caulobacterales bacterium]